MNRSLARNAIVLGLLSAVGPFAIDMYLPALPSIAAEFRASDAAAQGSLVAFFLAVAFGQIVYGPVSDSLGRRAPLYFGMVLYSLGRDRLQPGAVDRVADRRPLPPGHRRLRRHDHPARHRARPPHRRRTRPG